MSHFLDICIGEVLPIRIFEHPGYKVTEKKVDSYSIDYDTSGSEDSIHGNLSQGNEP